MEEKTYSIAEKELSAKVSKSKLRKAALAESISVSVRSIDNLMSKKIIPFYRIGGIYLFDLEEVNEALRRFRVEAVGESQS